MVDQLAIVNACTNKNFYEYFFLLKIQIVLQAIKLCILDVTLQDVTLELTSPYQSITLTSTPLQ